MRNEGQSATMSPTKASSPIAVPRVTLIFLGFPPAQSAPILAGPSRRVIVELPQIDRLPNGRQPAMLDLMARVKNEHLADDLAIDLSRASVYTGPPDFALVKPTSPLGLLRDGEFLIVVCSYPNAQQQQHMQMQMQIQQPYSDRSPMTRDLATPTIQTRDLFSMQSGARYQSIQTLPSPAATYPTISPQLLQHYQQQQQSPNQLQIATRDLYTPQQAIAYPSPATHRPHDNWNGNPHALAGVPLVDVSLAKDGDRREHRHHHHHHRHHRHRSSSRHRHHHSHHRHRSSSREARRRERSDDEREQRTSRRHDSRRERYEEEDQDIDREEMTRNLLSIIARGDKKDRAQSSPRKTTRKADDIDEAQDSDARARKSSSRRPRDRDGDGNDEHAELDEDARNSSAKKRPTSAAKRPQSSHEDPFANAKPLKEYKKQSGGGPFDQFDEFATEAKPEVKKNRASSNIRDDGDRRHASSKGRKSDPDEFDDGDDQEDHKKHKRADSPSKSKKNAVSHDEEYDGRSDDAEHRGKSTKSPARRHNDNDDDANAPHSRKQSPQKGSKEKKKHLDEEDDEGDENDRGIFSKILSKKNKDDKNHDERRPKNGGSCSDEDVDDFAEHAPQSSKKNGSNQKGKGQHASAVHDDDDYEEHDNRLKSSSVKKHKDDQSGALSDGDEDHPGNSKGKYGSKDKSHHDDDDDERLAPRPGSPKKNKQVADPFADVEFEPKGKQGKGNSSYDQDDHDHSKRNSNPKDDDDGNSKHKSNHKDDDDGHSKHKSNHKGDDDGHAKHKSNHKDDDDDEGHAKQKSSHDDDESAHGRPNSTKSKKQKPGADGDGAPLENAEHEHTTSKKKQSLMASRHHDDSDAEHNTNQKSNSVKNNGKLVGASKTGRPASIDEDLDDPNGQNSHNGGQTDSAFSSPNSQRPPLRRALLIGINYTGQKVQLKGCINDVKKVKEMLVNTLGYEDSPEVIRVLTDDAKDPKMVPSKKNILASMEWLRKGVQPRDSLYFHFSGHGSQQASLDSYEDLDETLVPIDYVTAGQITDNELNERLVHGLPKGLRMTCVFDCCHSGTILDLPFQYDQNGDSRGSPDLTVEHKSLNNRSTPADVICLSGCLDEQTSADASFGGIAAGAMTYALMETIKKSAGQKMSFKDTVKSIRDILRAKKYSQKPQLSAGHQLDFAQAFFV